jgi:hypothetical protein
MDWLEKNVVEETHFSRFTAFFEGFAMDMDSALRNQKC